MKKAIIAFFTLFFMIPTLSGALAAEKKNKPEIKTIDNYIAVFDFEVTTGDKGISRPLTDRVIHEFSMSDRYKVIDRGNMNKILKEQKFQMSGCVAQECKVEAGQLLGVGKIVNGSVGIVGKTYYLTLQLIDVRTGEILNSAEDECRCEIDELLGSTRRLAKKLLGDQVAPAATTELKPATVAESKTEAIERVKAEQMAKAKAEAEEIAKAKAKDDAIAKAKAEAEAIAKAKVEADEIAKSKAKAEEIERVKAAQTAKAKAEAIAEAEKLAKAKAEEIARIKAVDEELARQKSILDLEKHRLALEKQELERQKRLVAEQEQLAAEKRKFEAEKQQQIAMESLTTVTRPIEIAKDGSFIAYDNGTVLDTRTNLMWAAKDNGSNIVWQNAKNYCKNYRGGGYSDWRLPTQNELASLYDPAKSYQSECKGLFSTWILHLTELIRLTCNVLWASDNPPALNFNNAYATNFDFSDGTRGWFAEINGTNSRALPVRSVK